MRALAEALGSGLPQRGSAAAACRPTTTSLQPGPRTALGDADVALVIGVPLDFRLGFGGAFGETRS